MVKIAATARGNVTRAQGMAVDAPFPNCAEVVPTPGREGKLYDPRRHGASPFTHTRIGINARQFAQTLHVVSDLAADDNTVVMTVPVDPTRPIRLDARCPGRRAAAAIMPVHVQSDPRAVRNNGDLRQHITSELSNVQSALDAMPVDQPRRRILRSQTMPMSSEAQ